MASSRHLIVYPDAHYPALFHVVPKSAESCRGEDGRLAFARRHLPHHGLCLYDRVVRCVVPQAELAHLRRELSEHEDMTSS